MEPNLNGWTFSECLGDNFLGEDMKRRFVAIFLMIMTNWMPRCAAQESSTEIQDVSLDSLLNLRVNSAAKYDQTVSQAPASVTIIMAEEIDYFGYRTLDEVLIHVRSFYTSNDRDYAYVGARGFGRPDDFNNRILLLLNGHTLNDNVYGSALIGSELCISLDFIERIEIVRGPGSALYGDNAMFAVINLITKKGNLIDGAKFTMDVGSYGLVQGAVRAGKESNGGTDLAVSGLWGNVTGQDLYYREYDHPSTNNGVARGLDWDKPRSVVATLTTGDFTMQGLATSRKKGIPTGDYGMTFNDPSAQSLDERYFLEAQYHGLLDANKKVMVRGSIDKYYYAGTYPYDGGLQYDFTNNIWLGGEFQFIWDVETGDRLTLGSEFKHNSTTRYRSWSDKQTIFDMDFPFSVYSIYVQNELQILENLTLTIGARGDKTTGYDATMSPRGALVYNPSRASTLKLLYGEAFRAPNIYELYYEDPVSRAKSNPGLKPERIKTLEVVLEHRVTSFLFATASAYNYRVTNLINPAIDPSDSMSFFKNLSIVETNGIEFEINAKTEFGLQGSLSQTFQNAVEAVSKESLPNSPAQVSKLGLSYQASRQLNLALQIVRETGRKTVYDNETPPVLLTNINVHLRPRAEGGTFIGQFLNHLRCSFLVRNLFNASYETPGSLDHRQAAILQNGRNVSLKLEYAI